VAFQPIRGPHDNPTGPVGACAAYRGGVRDIVIYTGLRLALLAAVWLLLQVVTPFRGLLAIVVALLISGVVSVVLLDRPRDRAGNRVAGVFRRIDERIERSRTAEDYDDEVEPGTDSEPAGGARSGQAEPQAEEHAVGEGEDAGRLQDPDQRPPLSSP